MFKFNISEEILFNIRNGDFQSKKFEFKDKYLHNRILERIYNDRVLVICGLDSIIRDKICVEIIYNIFLNNYKKYDINVFKVSCIDELDEIYLEDKVQIFYLNDFFGKINFKFDKFKYYFNKVFRSESKFLILNVREFVINKISNFNLCEDLNNYKDSILINTNNNYIKNPNILEEIYLKLSYIDKFVLFSLFFKNIDDIDIWMKITRNYFFGKGVFDEGIDFSELILESFQKLENYFIFLSNDGKFIVENLVVEEFLFIKLKNEVKVIKDILNNIMSYSNLVSFVDILEISNIKVKYYLKEYEDSLKVNLFEIICSNNLRDVVGTLKFSLNLFSIIEIQDRDILENLNTKIIYSDININKSIEYFSFIKNYKQFLIVNDIFKNKLFKLIYDHKIFRDFEFYRYSFKYFLFVSEFYNLYGSIDCEEFLDIKKNFDRLINIILNNVNSYFTLEYFSLNTEIKQALVDLKILIYDFNVKDIFLENVYEIFNNVKEILFELFNDATRFIPKNKQEYYVLVYFKNEVEKNRDFIEFTFENINLDIVFQKMDENICKFKA